MHEQLDNDSVSFCEFSHDSDIFDLTDGGAKICGGDFSDSCKVSGNVGGDVGGNGRYNDEGDDNEYWALWDENNHDFYMMPYCASSDYKAARMG
jgi:hypothetical protein